MEVFLDMINIMQARSAVANPSECDCYIRPEVNHYYAWSFGDAEQILEAGKAAAEIVIPKLKKDLRLK